jgi:hypothetical protein
MTKDFVIENVKAGDMLFAYNEDDGTLAHQWIVLENYHDEVRNLGFIDVFVVYAQSYLEQRYSFYYDTFKSYRRMMEWSVEHVS